MSRVMYIICWLAWVFIVIFHEKITPFLKDEMAIYTLRMYFIFGIIGFSAHARIDDLEKHK